MNTPAHAVDTAATLADEHALLLREVGLRAEAVLAGLSTSAWPQREVHQLLDYLYVELLQQVANEEWLLFRTWHHSPAVIDELRAEHLELRVAIDRLTDAVTGADRTDSEQLEQLVRDLLETVQAHFTAEEDVLQTEATPPSTASLGGAPHELYTMVEGPVIELASLPGAQGVDAVLGRLLRMEPGETIELRAPSDPAPIWRRLAAADPAGYGFSYLDQGADGWRVEIVRRTT